MCGNQTSFFSLRLYTRERKSDLKKKNKTVAIAGLGAIGMRVAKALDSGVEGLVLTAVSARDLKNAEQRVSEFSRPPESYPTNRDCGICRYHCGMCSSFCF